LSSISTRKQKHIAVTLKENVESEIQTGFKDTHLIHRSIPEIDLSEIDISTYVFGKKINAPLIISSITGGTKEAEKINKILALTAEKYNIGIGVGSQRIAIEHPETKKTFSVVRDNAPNSFIIANLGCPQLSLGWGVKEAREAVEMISADALAIHMNPLQEAIQINGDTNFRGTLQKIDNLAASLSTPIIMKETGCGISYYDAKKLEDVGVAGFDVSGLGGTSWAAVEHHIAKSEGKDEQEHLGKVFWNWGIPTVCSLIEVRNATNRVVLASGGIRTGLEMAKSIALGADGVGIAKPFLEKAVQGKEELEKHIQKIINELKLVMFLVSARNIDDLKHVPIVVTGWTAEYIRRRGFNLESLAQRGK